MSEHTESGNMQYGTGKKTLKTYLVGFVLCVILTVIPFYMVANHVAPSTDLLITVMAFAVAQLFVQVVFFLRLNATSDGQWNLMPFLFTIFVVLVVVIGSMWIMYNLNYNMMH